MRWHQTADVGYVTNDHLENVFMATAVDSDIDLHPKNKRLTATRLSWAAENLVYKKDKPLQGPQSVGVIYNPAYRRSIVVNFNAKHEPVVVEKDRFAVCCLVQTVKSPKGLSGKICPREVPRVIRLSQRGVAPRESLITRGTSRGQIFQTIPEDFSLFVF